MDLEARKDAFLTKMTDYIEAHIPRRFNLVTPSIVLKEYYHQQLSNIVKHDSSAYFNWCLNAGRGINISISIRPDGTVTYLWSAKDRHLNEVTACLDLYRDVVSFACPLEIILKEELPKLAVDVVKCL